MYKKNTHIHFMGIGGIGMSGIAKILLEQGYRVSGCDQNLDQSSLKKLIDLGCAVAPHHEHDLCLDPSITALVYSTDVLKINPGKLPAEIAHAQARKVPTIVRAAMLAELMRTKFSIAIAGSHGKTTTSSLASHLLLHAKLAPTVVVGGHMHGINTNAQHGSGAFLVAEADESDRSFLLLPKSISIVTNINREHLDVYQDFDDIKQTFLQFLNQLPFYGSHIICIDDPGVQMILPDIKTAYTTYGTLPAADLQAQNIELLADNCTFDIFDKKHNKLLGSITLPLAGVHNVLNATAVVALGLRIEIPFETIKNALSCFQGVDRRFTFKGITSRHQALIFDDYGHHPHEIKHTLAVARKKAHHKLVVVFQPQRFSRTKHLWPEFVDLFATSSIDQIIITDIFPASETPIDGITSERLVHEIKQKNPQAPVLYLPFSPDGQAVVSYLDTILQAHDVVLLQGAGKVNKIAPDLLI